MCFSAYSPEHKDVPKKRRLDLEPRDYKSMLRSSARGRHTPTRIDFPAAAQPHKQNPKKHTLLCKNPAEEILRWYGCDMCQYRSKQKGNLKQHQQLKHKKEVKTLRCDKCPFRTKHRGRLIFHTSSHEVPVKTEPYRCPHCSLEVTSKGNLDRHILLHQKPVEIRESYQYKSKSKDDLKQHQLKKHTYGPEVEMFQCDRCPYQSKYRGGIDAHRLTHEYSAQNGLYQCRHCDRKLKTVVTLNRHLKLHGGDPSGWHECESCDFKSQHNYSLKMHRLKHMEVYEVETFKCGECPFQTKHRASINRHQWTHEAPIKRELHECHVCNLKLTTRQSLRIHMSVHKDASEILWFKCRVCDYRSNHKGNLKNHQLIHKDVEAPNEASSLLKQEEWSHEVPAQRELYQCHHCDRKLTTKQSLMTHLVLHKKPSEIRWFECGVCNYRSHHKGNLKNHQMKHRGVSDVEMKIEAPYPLKQELTLETPTKRELYQCHLCSLKLTTKSSLKTHMVVHKNPEEIKWFECGVCDYRSNHKGNLKTHKMKHRGGLDVDTSNKASPRFKQHRSTREVSIKRELYQCHLCSFILTTKSSLKTHMVVHKNPEEIKWYDCNFCHYRSNHKGNLKEHKLKHKDVSDIKVERDIGLP